MYLVARTPLLTVVSVYSGEDPKVNECYISRSAVLTCGLWALALAMVAGVWVLTIFNEPDRWISAMGLTAILALSVAATSQVRLHITRLCAVVRATSSPEDAPPRLHAMR